jgi:GNAT superfamily N-acetyltransferase
VKRPALQTDTVTVSIELLADHPDLVPPVGRMRWNEWGTPPEPTELNFWVEVTRREAGRDQLPVTWVAVDTDGRAIGAVGIDEFDPDDFRDRSPWLVGMIVDGERRRQGVGKSLVRALEGWASEKGLKRVWVATGPPGGPAEAFYQHCGWTTVDGFATSSGEPAVILERRLDA